VLSGRGPLRVRSSLRVSLSHGCPELASREGMFPGVQVRLRAVVDVQDEILIMRLGKPSSGDKCAQETRADAR